MFVPNYATVTPALPDLTKKEQPHYVKWNDEREGVFHKIKRRLPIAPNLRLPNFEKNLVLHTDASDGSLGAVSQQEHKVTLHFFAYVQRWLLLGEATYWTVEKTWSAVGWGIENYRTYQYGRRFIA